jgi:2-polyprenyl-6-methoxyphenol hydroxylase-like FAD-dependent oxidoreductase/DNA-binding IclR family transcriptional regulator
MRELTIAIAGAGIGGLTAALALQRAGFKVRVYEQAPKLVQVGAGLSLSPTAAYGLRHLGLGRVLDDLAFRPENQFARHYTDGQLLMLSNRGSALMQRFGERYYLIHRADLHEGLAAAVRANDERAIVLDHRLVQIESRTDGLTLQFANGRTEHVQALIAADGQRSFVRESLFGPGAPRYTGYVAWRALIPTQRLNGTRLDPQSGIFIGPGHMVNVYPVQQGAALNFVAFAERSEWTDGVRRLASRRRDDHRSHPTGAAVQVGPVRPRTDHALEPGPRHAARGRGASRAAIPGARRGARDRGRGGAGSRIRDGPGRAGSLRALRESAPRAGGIRLRTVAQGRSHLSRERPKPLFTDAQKRTRRRGPGPVRLQSGPVPRVARRKASESAAGERSRAVARALGALEELSVAASPLSNHELAMRLNVPPASMYRLLQKLASLGYVEYSSTHTSYGVAPRLGELGERLADAGCRAPPLRKLLAALRADTGFTVTVWVSSGLSVRLAALLAGETRGPSSNAPGELAAPFSTPGLAIASQFSAERVRDLVAQGRRRHAALGRQFRAVTEIEKALREVRNRGFAVGYNLRQDGWGMLAWPIPVTHTPLRIGALAVGAPVAVLRREEARLLQLTQRLVAGYLREQRAAIAPAVPPAARS